MEYTLKPLTAEHMFMMFQLLSKLGVKDLREIINPDSIKKLMEVAKDKQNNKNTDLNLDTIFGATMISDVVSLVVRNIPYCKNEVYNLLSSLSGIPNKELAKVDMVTFTNMIIDVVKKPEFKDFFKAVSRLLK